MNKDLFSEDDWKFISDFWRDEEILSFNISYDLGKEAIKKANEDTFYDQITKQDSLEILDSLIDYCLMTNSKKLFNIYVKEREELLAI